MGRVMGTRRGGIWRVCGKGTQLPASVLRDARAVITAGQTQEGGLKGDHHSPLFFFKSPHLLTLCNDMLSCMVLPYVKSSFVLFSCG